MSDEYEDQPEEGTPLEAEAEPSPGTDFANALGKLGAISPGRVAKCELQERQLAGGGVYLELNVTLTPEG